MQIVEWFAIDVIVSVVSLMAHSVSKADHLARFRCMSHAHRHIPIHAS